MSSHRTISLWILVFGMMFATISANPVVVEPLSSTSDRVRMDPNPDHIHQVGVPEEALPRVSAVETQVHEEDDQDPSALDDEIDDLGNFDLDDDDDDDEDFMEMDDEMAMEEEMFKKLEGSTVPKRVVKMMKEISENDQFMNGKGNTVRSYMPLKRQKCTGLGEAYVFSMRPMHSLDDPEELKYAELHFYAKNFLDVDSHEFEEIPISFYYIKDAECHPIGIQNLKIPKNGWLVTNVTSLLNHVLVDATEKVTIAMYIGEGVASHETTPYQDGTHEKLVKPFVFLYTEDVSAEKGNAQSNWQRLADKLARQEKDALLPERGVRRRRSAGSNETDETPDDNETLFSNEVVDVEPIDNNEYPLHPVGKTFPATTHTAFSFFAEQNMRRIKSNRRRARNQRRKEKSKNMMLEAADEKSRARKKKLNKPRPKHLDIGPVTEATDVCERRSMNVDFQAIGWDDYVIAPARFQAFYCAGQCAFPIQKELHPSNHALIQSIMHLLGVQTGVPTPCCVPDKMEPLILLYIEQDSTVTLKKYSDMIVESCGCH